jgi:hypothetical protein
VTFFRTPATATPEASPTAPASRPGRLPGWLSAAGILVALAIIVVAGLFRASWMPPALNMPSPGPPWQLTATISSKVIIVLLWISAVLATAGIAGALLTARRGLPVPMRTLFIGAAIAGLAMLLLPPFGSTDTLDYAVYGHIVGLGHSAYVMTPFDYRQLTHANGVPRDWQRNPSVYGPLATALQYLSAKLGGASLARTTFWLKLFNTAAFAAIAYVADRTLRGNATARIRAHLLWTVNPLVLWAVIAGGHVDVLAAAFGVAAVLIVDRQLISRPLVNALVAGLCVGAATDIKAVFGLYALGIAWAVRRAPRQLLAALAGGLVVLIPSYAWAGTDAIRAVTSRAQTGSGWGFYGFIFHRAGVPLHWAVPAAACLFVLVAWLALTRIPAGFNDRPAVRAALALSMAWLLVWPHQYAWYSLMAICLLILFPASRLDWIALAWLGVLTYADMPGVGVGLAAEFGHPLLIVQRDNLERFAPLVMLVILVLLVYWSITRKWDVQSE